MPASDVYSWAKAASKPSYTAGEVGALPVTGGTVTGDTVIQKVVTTNVTMGRGVIYFAGDTSNDNSNNYLLFSPNWGTQNAVIVKRQTFRPVASSYMYLGDSSHMWNQLYATNGSISTSDRNEKENISYIGKDSKYKDTYMSDGQLIKFMCGILPCIFKRINGESGRPHHGIIAQDFEELMKKIGLHDHAAFIKSPKTEEIETTKEDGSKEIKTQEIPGEYIYGIRYEELISDVIRFSQIMYDRLDNLEGTVQKQQEKITSLEEKLSQLERMV